MKKVLMICYMFPPLGPTGTIRYLEFAKFLPKFGWEPIVLTVKNPSRFQHKDGSLHIPKNLKVYRSIEIPTIYIFKLIQKFANRAVSAFLYYGWLPHTVYKACKIIKKEQIDIIFAGCQPNTTALIGYLLKKLTKKPLVIDFRDAVIGPGRIDRRLFDICVKNADLNLIVTEPLREFFKQGNFAFIPNGYIDPPELPQNPLPPTNKFVILYAGSIYPTYFPILKNFFIALKDYIKYKNDVELRFIGYNHKKMLLPIISKVGLDLKDVKFSPLGRVPYITCLHMIKQASINLIFRPSAHNFALGTKIFDYILSEAPVMGILDEANETAKFIRKANVGIVVPNNPPAILAGLKKLADNSKFQRNQEFINQFHRRNLTKKLANLFNNILEGQS